MIGYVSDYLVTAVLQDLKVNRAKRREIQSMSKEDLQHYLVNLYLAGFEDGAAAIEKRLKKKAEEKVKQEAEEAEEVSIGWEDVLEVISTVKGIGPKMLEAIDAKLKEAY